MSAAKIIYQLYMCVVCGTLVFRTYWLYVTVHKFPLHYNFRATVFVTRLCLCHDELCGQDWSSKSLEVPCGQNLIENLWGVMMCTCGKTGEIVWHGQCFSSRIWSVINDQILDQWTVHELYFTPAQTPVWHYTGTGAVNRPSR